MRSLKSSWYTWLCKHGVLLFFMRICTKKSNRNILYEILEKFLVGRCERSEQAGRFFQEVQ